MQVARPCVALSRQAFETCEPLVAGADLPVRFATIVDPTTALLEGQRFDPAELPAEIVWMTREALIGRLREPFRRLLDRAETLRWVHTASAGYDVPVLQAALQRGVRLTIAHINKIPVAEFVIRSVLERYQRSDRLRDLRAQRKIARFEFREVHGTTWLIYGLGAVGGEIALRARAFGVRTIGVRRNANGAEPVDEMITPGEVAQHLARADVVVLCAPPSPQTAGLVNAEFLARMKPDAILVNVARGSLVDEGPLLAALDSGRLDWAVLDVHSIEDHYVRSGRHAPCSPLWAHPRIELTPHVAACGLGRHARSARLFVDNLHRYLAGEPLPDEIRAA